MKIVFIDTEFTSLHAFATLVSAGMVTMDGREHYVSLNDYDRDQITPWVRDNVLSKIDESKSVSTLEALNQTRAFLESYGKGEKISFITPGKCADLTLVFQLWHAQYPERKYFHFSDCLPNYLCHREHIDLDTLFFAAGLDPDVEREDYVSAKTPEQKHNALFDAQVVRLCFLKMIRDGLLPKITARLHKDPEFIKNSQLYFQELNC